MCDCCSKDQQSHILYLLLNKHLSVSCKYNTGDYMTKSITIKSSRLEVRLVTVSSQAFRSLDCYWKVLCLKEEGDATGVLSVDRHSPEEIRQAK